MKRILVFFAIIISTISLLSCSDGIKHDEAKEHINDFFAAIEKGDYKLAATLLHPERPADLKAFFESLENENNLDFSKIEINRYTSFSTVYYDSTVSGSKYSLSIDTDVNGRDVDFDIEIVKNDNGYGIYNLNIYPKN